MRKILMTLAVLCTVLVAKAQTFNESMWGNTPPLHVEGKYFVDPYGNKVVLHGVMDTPSPYFNGYRWQPAQSNTTGIRPCVAYFNSLFDGLADPSRGTYCNLFRLHLDPCWLNSNSIKAEGFVEKDGKVYDPHGNAVGGEANIYHFSKSMLKQYLKSLYFPIAKEAIDHGMYVIMRPPGVFPENVQVDDYYNDYIMTVWDIVSQNDSIKKYSGQIMLELGNEPVNLRNASGANDDRALHDFFQPVVEKIRANGYEGIILIPGTGWQGNYRPFAKFPITGKNIGYAVHNYVGWYGGNDRVFSETDLRNYANEFHNSVPIMDTNPIVITEVDWSPEKEGTGHYNEHGNWVLSNYGTWATGNTSKWGKAYKYLLTKYDNISMTLSGTGCYLDQDDCFFRNTVTPAFKKAMEAKGLDPYEGSGVACFEWYKEWAKVDYARPDLSTDSIDKNFAITSFTRAEKVDSAMVGQKVNIAFDAKFANGITSKIPAFLCKASNYDNTVVEMKENALVAVGEGKTDITLTYTDGAGTKYEKVCTVVVLPVMSLDPFAIATDIKGSGSFVKRGAGLTTARFGIGGWVFDQGIDASAYKYLVIKLSRYASCDPKVVISNSDDSNVPYYSAHLGEDTEIVIDLNNMTRADGTKVNPADLRMIGFESNGGNVIYIKQAFFSNDGVNPATAINTPVLGNAAVASEIYFNANGQRIARPVAGVNIVRQTLTDGTTRTKKILIK